MKRLILTLLPLALLAGGVATTSLTSAATQNCAGHGYSSGYCQPVGPGQTGTISVPGVSSTLLTLSFTNGTGATLDIEATSVAVPPGAPAGSTCFAANIFDHSSGAELTGTLSNPIVFQTQGTVYSYDSSTGGFSQLGTGSTGYPVAYSGGTFCVSFSGSTGPGLPATGGAA